MAAKKEACIAIHIPGGSASASKTHGDHHTSAPSTHCRHPFPRTVRFPQGSRGAGSPTPPLPRRWPRSARSGPARPSPRHSRLQQLRRRSSPAPASPHPLPAEAAPPRIRAARGPAGRNTWGFCARNRKLPFRSAPSPPWGLSRLWEDCLFLLCPLVLGGSPGRESESTASRWSLLFQLSCPALQGDGLWGCGGECIYTHCPCSGGVWRELFFSFSVSAVLFV